MGRSNENSNEREWNAPGSKELASAYLEAKGVRLENVKWQDLALCRGLTTNWFFDDYEQSSEHARAIDDICDLCPVKTLCYEQGIDNKEWGVHGGVYLNGRGGEDKKFSRHKIEKEQDD